MHVRFHNQNNNYKYCMYSCYAKQKHPGCKKVRANEKQPNLYVQPKALISAEVKKSPIKGVSNYLNDIQ